jgi:AcrR family transcriptional regulator
MKPRRPNGYRKGTENKTIHFLNLLEKARTLTDKRQRILRGMLDAVGAEGYERTTVQSALDRSGIYRQAFYDFFRDKEDCYLAALDVGVEWVEAEMRGGAATGTVWRERLRGALAALLRFLDDEPDVGRALLVEVHAAGPQAVEKRTAAMERAAALMDGGRGETYDSPPAISAEAVVAGILAVLHARLAAGQRDDFVRLLPELMYLAVLPYFGPDEAAAEMREEFE